VLVFYLGMPVPRLRKSYRHNTYLKMNTVTATRKLSLRMGFVKLLSGVLAMFILFLLLKTLIDSFQQAEKATRPVRQTANAVRTADKMMKVVNLELQNEAIASENVWITEQGDSLPNPYTKEQTKELIDICLPKNVNNGSINGRKAYHLIDQSIQKWNKIPFDEIMNTFRKGKMGVDKFGKKYKYDDNWIIPLTEHNQTLKSATIYRTSARQIKNFVNLK